MPLNSQSTELKYEKFTYFSNSYTSTRENKNTYKIYN